MIRYGGIMARVKVLDKNLKVVKPGLRCRFRDVTMRKRNGEQLRLLVQGDTALIESVAPGEIHLKADRPVLKAVNGSMELEEEDQPFVVKTRFVDRFKAWVANTKKDGIDVFVELLE